ncbi:histidine--tRNA ligase [Aminithiophilus ramosus]|uniref:Histidine--tRNA ligase n=2 Tax=Synergistales TaxID=649776 RepID=A0A9Q7AL73_9BACT|nr:histidine--tRNA ligase [Aminithiophilus ramosus]QTX31762.1 histidine--tRNA ligase [Aminithiophilus ramosus]QVL35584.1 histidine--tRNA ligase [Synergistota bacterium]
MAEITAPRGVRDVLPDESWKWAYVLGQFRQIADGFGFSEIHLPIFEHTELFCRGIGDTTDVVEKEMYTFEDRSGRSLTLRPEVTASTVRSYLEQNMASRPQPVKLWTAGPMFRYERPQKGRYRQFWQLDVEVLGSDSPLVDVEVIELSLELYRRLGMTNLEVVINSVGCPACRPAYREALRAYLRPHLGELCESCRSRFDRNPLRILDCKNPTCKAITEGAPDVMDSLCDECSGHFAAVRKGLDLLGARTHIDKRLVRGLDYYTKTAYEVLSGDLGAQNAVCGGGRYDNLAESIGGPHLPGVGFASGIERIVLTMEQQGCSFGREPALDAYVIAVDETARDEALKLLYALRREGLSADMDYQGRAMKAQFKSASQAAFACILGGDEVARSVVALKEMASGNQEECAFDGAAQVIRSRLGR